MKTVNDKIYTVTLTQQQYSDIMVALAKVDGNHSFFPMKNLHEQLNDLIEADVEAIRKENAEEEATKQETPALVKTKKKAGK